MGRKKRMNSETEILINHITESKKNTPKNGDPAIAGARAALKYITKPIPFARIPK